MTFISQGFLSAGPKRVWDGPSWRFWDWRTAFLFEGKAVFALQSKARLSCSQNPEGQHEDVPDQVKAQLYGKAQEPERQQKQPYDGVKEKGDDGNGPAKDEKDAPEDEGQHVVVVFPAKLKSRSKRGNQAWRLRRAGSAIVPVSIAYTMAGGVNGKRTQAALP